MLFGEMASTPDPNIKETQRQILLSTLSSLKNNDPSIVWDPYQFPSGALPITSFLAITITENN